MLIIRRQPRNHSEKDSRKAGRERVRERESGSVCAVGFCFLFQSFSREKTFRLNVRTGEGRDRERKQSFSRRENGGKQRRQPPFKASWDSLFVLQSFWQALLCDLGGRVRGYNHFMASSLMGRLVSMLWFGFVASWLWRAEAMARHA